MGRWEDIRSLTRHQTARGGRTRGRGVTLEDQTSHTWGAPLSEE